MEEEKKSTKNENENQEIIVLCEKKVTQTKQAEETKMTENLGKIAIKEEAKVSENEQKQKENLDGFEDFL